MAERFPLLRTFIGLARMESGDRAGALRQFNMTLAEVCSRVCVCLAVFGDRGILGSKLGEGRGLDRVH